MLKIFLSFLLGTLKGMPKYFFNFVLGILHFQLLYRTLKSNLKIIPYVLNNNFSYTQLSFVFLPRKDYYFDHDDTEVFFFFFFRKILLSFIRLFFFFFWSYLFTTFMYIQKNIKIFLLVILVFFNFLHQNFFHQNFLRQNFICQDQKKCHQ